MAGVPEFGFRCHELCVETERSTEEPVFGVRSEVERYWMGPPRIRDADVHRRCIDGLQEGFEVCGGPGYGFLRIDVNIAIDGGRHDVRRPFVGHGDPGDVDRFPIEHRLRIAINGYVVRWIDLSAVVGFTETGNLRWKPIDCVHVRPIVVVVQSDVSDSWFCHGAISVSGSCVHSFPQYQ